MDLTLVVLEGGSGDPGLSSDSSKDGVSREVKSRLQEASGEYVLVVARGHRLDGELFERLWARRAEAEVLLASRYLRGGGSEASALASLATRLANRVLRRALRLPCHDLVSGIRLYKRSALEELGVTTLERRSSLDLLVRLYNLGFKLREVAYHEREGRSLGEVLAEQAAAFRELPRLAKIRRSPEAADVDDVGLQNLSPWRRRRLEERNRTIVSFLEVDVRVLDVGCGSSRLIQSLSRGAGLDRDLRKLRFLRGRARVIVGGELPRLPFRDGSFPQVVLSDVIASLAPSTPYLPELRRVLSSRGTLVLAAGASRRSEVDLREELQRNGFTVDEVRKIRGAELVIRAVRKES